MRINKYLASSTGISRRSADAAIMAGQITVNGQTIMTGYDVQPDDKVLLDGQLVAPSAETITISLHKPIGYVVSRNGQGSRTVYDLLPINYQGLKPAGRLDKDSSGLLILTSDGNLANYLTHPRYAKTKIYHIELDKPLHPSHRHLINHQGVQLEDGKSQFKLEPLSDQTWKVVMTEGRNRQIRRTFSRLGYSVIKLHRVSLGNIKLGNLKTGQYTVLNLKAIKSLNIFI